MEKITSIPSIHIPSREIDSPGRALSQEDYVNLCRSLQKRGEMCLVEGDLSGIKYFEQALELDPSNPKLLCEQGLALFECGETEDNEKTLAMACRRFNAATKLRPSYFEAWYAWGNTLVCLGDKTRKESYFLRAKKKFDRAYSIATDASGDFLCDYAYVLLQLAKRSEEVTDYTKALQAYQRASTLQDSLPAEFWLEYGEATFAVARYASNTASFGQAADCFKRALSAAIASSDSWASLARAMSELAEHTHEEDHFAQASECFSTAIGLDPRNAPLHLQWAHLLYNWGKWLGDDKHLLAAIDKCRIAHRFKRRDMRAIALWAQALALLGMRAERLDMIRQAEEKIERAIEKHDSLPELWEAYGNIYLCTAHYHNDLDSYYQAIDAFQTGLQINRSRFTLWIGLGTATTRAASIEGEGKMHVRAARFFKKALDLHISATTHFLYGNALVHQEADVESLTLGVTHMSRAIQMQPYAIYSHPNWMFYYGCALDALGSYSEKESDYLQAIEALTQVLHVNPDYPEIHYQLGLTYAHYGDLITDQDLIRRALHHFRIAHTQDKENDYAILDWATTLINFADLFPEDPDSSHALREAEYKLIQAAKLGNTYAYYTLACLYALLNQAEKSVYFLEKAYTFQSLPPIDELTADDWLEGIQDSEPFRLFLDQIPKL